MTTATQLGLVEVDLLATYTGGTIPFPLKVPSFGRIPAERDELFAGAGATLHHRGLATDSGPSGLAQELATALKHRHATLDLITLTHDGPVGLVMILYHQQALLCQQHLTDAPTSLIDVQAVRTDRLADVLLDHIPEISPANVMSIRVPADAIRDIYTSATAHPDRNPRQLLHQYANRYRCPVEALDAIVRIGNATTRHGQLGATRATPHGDTRVGTELSWVDTPTGRLSLSTHRTGQHEWISINPLRYPAIRSAVTTLIAQTRR